MEGVRHRPLTPGIRARRRGRTDRVAEVDQGADRGPLS